MFLFPQHYMIEIKKKSDNFSHENNKIHPTQLQGLVNKIMIFQLIFLLFFFCQIYMYLFIIIFLHKPKLKRVSAHTSMYLGIYTF